MDADTDALRGVQFFENLSDEHIEQLAQYLQPRRRREGESVFKAGDAGRALYVVASGEVRISTQSPIGENVILAQPGPGDVFGELALLDTLPRSASATATTDTELLMLMHNDFMDLLDRDPSLGRSVLMSLAGMIRQMNVKLIEVATVDPPTRLGKAIKQLMDRYGRQDPEGVTIDHHVSIDYLVGLTLLYRSEVDRVMKQWEYENFLVWERGAGRLTVKRPDKL